MRPHIRPPRILEYLRADVAYVPIRPDYRPRDAVVAEQDVGVAERLDDRAVQPPRLVVRREVRLERGEFGLRACRREGLQLRDERLRLRRGRVRVVVHRDGAPDAREGLRRCLPDATSAMPPPSAPRIWSEGTQATYVHPVIRTRRPFRDAPTPAMTSELSGSAATLDVSVLGLLAFPELELPVVWRLPLNLLSIRLDVLSSLGQRTQAARACLLYAGRGKTGPLGMTS